MGKGIIRVFKKKNSLKLNAASHNNTSWYTDTNVFLEYPHIRGSHWDPPSRRLFPSFSTPCILKRVKILILRSNLYCNLLTWEKFKLKLRKFANSTGVIVYHFVFVKTKSKTIVPFKCNVLEK